MTEKLIIDPEVEDGNPKKNMHWKIVLLLSAVVLVAMFIKFGGGSTRNTEFKPTPVQPAQLGPAGDPTSIDKGKAEAEERERMAKAREQADRVEAKRSKRNCWPSRLARQRMPGQQVPFQRLLHFRTLQCRWPAQRRLAASSSWNGRNRIAPGAHCFRS